jgi:multidrug efflux pump subunit AcrA (membrane-fusion protein)
VPTLKTSRRINLILLVLILGGALYLGMRSSRAATPAATPAPAPVTISVTRGEVAQTVLAPGTLVSVRETLLSAETSGKLEALLVQPGSRVGAGQKIARMADGSEEAAAPFDGVIVELLARPGETVQPGQPLALLVDPSALEVRATVIEEDLPLVQAGMPAELYFDARPELALPGSVERIVPYRLANETRPLYAVYLSFELPQGGLAPGMTVDASIIVDRVENALRLPRGVIRSGDDGLARARVWVDGQVQERQVRTGLRGNAYFEILDGLNENDQVLGE